MKYLILLSVLVCNICAAQVILPGIGKTANDTDKDFNYLNRESGYTSNGDLKITYSTDDGQLSLTHLFKNNTCISAIVSVYNDPLLKAYKKALSDVFETVIPDESWLMTVTNSKLFVEIKSFGSQAPAMFIFKIRSN